MISDLPECEEHFLKKVNSRLNEVLSFNDSFLSGSTILASNAGKYLCNNSKAKKGRPMLVLYFGQAMGVMENSLIDLAVAAELIHTASLMHDDVIDNAVTRRGLETINIQFSNSIAVLAGNYLLSKAFLVLKGYPFKVTRDAISVVADMSKAAIAEVEIRGSLNATFDLRRDIALGKTGALFAWCGKSIALIANRYNLLGNLKECGESMGVAFQMVDDLRDLLDDSGLKNRFSDIINREPSFPLLVALSESSKVRSLLEKLWNSCDISRDSVIEAGDAILATNATKRTSEHMEHEIKASIDSLGDLQKTRGGQRLIDWLGLLKTQGNTSHHMNKNDIFS